MQPVNNVDKRKKIKQILIISALSLALLLILLLAASSIGGDKPQQTNMAADPDATPTPYGTEVITPFYTPTPKPIVTPTPVPTAAPSPTIPPIDMTATYKKGSSGDDVLAIQNMLNEIGLDAGTADGEYDDDVKAAVKNFQLYASLDNDGIAGPATLASLMNIWSGTFPKQLAEKPVLYGFTIGIDAGGQRVPNTDTELNSPNGTETKIKTPPTAEGTWSGIDGYVINLQIALQLQRELEALGANVVMVRDSHDVDISNIERAQMMNNARVDFWITINTPYGKEEELNGIYLRIPSDGSMATSDSRVYDKNQRLASSILKYLAAATGAENLGVKKTAGLTVFNWSEVPVCQVMMGYLTNEDEERLLITKTYQKKITNGIIRGIKDYLNVQ